MFLHERIQASETAAKSDAKHIAEDVVTHYVDVDADGGLSLTTGAGPSSWELSDAASVMVATGRLTRGNKIGPSSFLSLNKFCVSIQPAMSRASTWHAGPAGIAKGECPS